MNVLKLLVIAMLQSPTEGLNALVAPFDEPTKNTKAIAAEAVPLEVLKRRLDQGEFVAVPQKLLHERYLRSETLSAPDEQGKRTQIREARYSATLIGTKLQQGKAELDLYSDSAAHNAGPLLIGATSLQQLKLSDEQGALALGADADRRLFVLKPGVPERLSGSWTAEGLVAGEVITFRLELPRSTISRFELRTPPQIQVTSAGSLVLGPEMDDSNLKWDLIPGDASRLTFSCRAEPDLSRQGSLPLSGFSASHSLTGDTLTSRWTVGLPSVISPGTVITVRIPPNVRVTDVVLEDRRSVEWSATLNNHQQHLKIIVPMASPGASLQVSATSVLPQAETWNLPMLSPTQWQSKEGQHRGLILMPVSQITVLLPATIELDEWTLVGIQERDVVTRPDESREYQLTQFLPEASAVVRTSTSQPRISDAVVTIVEPAGRLSTVRCLVNVHCEGASIVELKWPVAAGWQVIAARYASNMRALFFEFPEAASATLTIHLPEALEPGSSRVFELQLQQTDSSDSQMLRLPLMVDQNTVRTHSLVVFPSVIEMNSDVQRRWSLGRRPITIDEIRRQAPWFPESRLVQGMQAFEADDTAILSANNLPSDDMLNARSIQIEHVIRIADGLIVENSRLVLPGQFASDRPLSFAIPSSAGVDLRWSVDGEPVFAKREDGVGTPAEWRHWTIPPASFPRGSSTVIRCESRRAVSPEFVAAIPKPQIDLPHQGTLQMFSSEEGLLSTETLSQESASAESQSTTWNLPPELETVTVKIDQNPLIQSGQTIEVHMLHLIGEKSGGLQRDVLAVANVSRTAGKNSLPLSLPGNTRPLVLVNGHRVQLQETSTGFAIPLPPSSADCQVLLTWTEPSEHPDRITGVRQLPRLFLSELAAPQCTHHILMDPGLELQSPVILYGASESTEITRILDRLLINTAADQSTTQASESISIPAEVRQFVIRWQLAGVQGWHPQTLIDSAVAEAPLAIQVTQLRRRRAILAGTFLIFLAACIGLRHTANHHRLALAVAATCVLGISFFVRSQIISAAMLGVFWGLSTGLFLVMISRWRWLRLIRRRPLVRSAAISVVWCLLMTSCFGGPQESPDSSKSAQSAASDNFRDADILVPEIQVPGSDIVYVRSSLIEAWRKRQANQNSEVPAAVVTSLQSRIVADSIDSIELDLSLGVAALSGSKEATFRIPLQGSRLVECFVDGIKVLPEPDGRDSIRVHLPASILLPFRGIDSQRPDIMPDGSRTGTAADASSVAAFTVHKVDCRLRPLTSRQASGVQFRLPGLPCADTSLEVISPEGLFSSARAQTPAGVVEWKPADGNIPLNSLAMADGIDIRLFQAGIEKGSPQLATVQILAINETVSGQQVLNCVCRFSRWNTLTPEVRYRVPEGYRLISVSATTGADVVTDLLWSAKDQNAKVQLPSDIGNEFVLSIQLICLTPANVENQSVPVAELQQFADCVAVPGLLLAVRAHSVFSVLPLEGNRISTVAFADLQAGWGQWLRRSDVIFQVPNGNPTCTIRLTPRSSVNEVRISQDISIHESQIDWKCQVDIETTVLPVFRHRLKINSENIITDVQVVAGEANRLDSWHRRGDQLIIQLKEGTTGLHKITVVGKQTLRPDDSILTLQSPHLQNTEIPETSMTIVDQAGLGLTFVKLGGAKPDERIEPDDLLLPGKPVRMQIINEEDPIVLQRLRPVNPIGKIAAIRSTEKVTFVLHLSQWSGSLGPLHMIFTEDAEFLQEPIVVAEGLRLPLVRESNEFVADQNVVKSLFDRPEFTVIWSMRVQEDQIVQNAAMFSWPEIFDGVQWSELLLVPLDASPSSPQLTVASTVVPEWLTAAALLADEDLALQKTGTVSLPLASALMEGKLFIPVRSVTDRSVVEKGRDILAVSDSIVWLSYGQSAVGETQLLLFAARTPSTCSIEIPDEIVVTELQAAESTRWEDATRKKVIIELNRPVTIVRTRWLSKRSEGRAMSTQLSLLPPFPADRSTSRTLTVLSNNGQRPVFSDTLEVLSSADLLSAQMANIVNGLNHAKPVTLPLNGDVFEALPSGESLVQVLSQSRNEFLKGFSAANRSTHGSASCRSTDSSAIVVSIRQRAEIPALFSMITAVLVLAVAAFARNRTAVDDGPPTSHADDNSLGYPSLSASTNTGSQLRISSAEDPRASSQAQCHSLAKNAEENSSSVSRRPCDGT